MNLCKYILPCGHCDKYDKPCNMTIKDFENYNILFRKDECKTKFKCLHHWVYDSTIDCPDDFTRKERYRCSICGEYRTEVVELKDNT